MTPKRRDNKGRILQIGEWQEPSGRYRFMYNDALGKRKIVYSWRLTEADPTPPHKHKDVPLREKEKQVMSLFMQGISGSDMTVVELAERYILLKYGVKQSTLANYKAVINNLKKTEFAYRRVDHQLQRSHNMKYYIESTKTTSGTRKIPMTEEVRELCERIVANRDKPRREPIIDGYGGFLFFDKEGKPRVALHWEKYIQHARDKYNREHALQLPPITPHVCRHTFCSNMARAGMNPKTLQYIMGHSDISVTMNVYTHLGLDDARAEFARLEEAKNELKMMEII